MFQQVAERARRAAAFRARERALALAERLRGEAPRGIEVSAGDGRVELSGRGLQHRFVLDPELRRLLARLR